MSLERHRWADSRTGAASSTNTRYTRGDQSSAAISGPAAALIAATGSRRSPWTPGVRGKRTGLLISPAAVAPGSDAAHDVVLREPGGGQRFGAGEQTPPGLSATL